MKLTSVLLGLLLGAAHAVSAAETSASPTPSTNAAAPARRSQPRPVLSPEIQADHHVTFRLRAPKVSEVVVNGQWADGRTALTKDTNGVWSATVGPIEPGVYEYSLTVDGLTMIDPGNPAIKPMREPRTSILHLPGQPPLPPFGWVAWPLAPLPPLPPLPAAVPGLALL